MHIAANVKDSAKVAFMSILLKKSFYLHGSFETANNYTFKVNKKVVYYISWTRTGLTIKASNYVN